MKNPNEVIGNHKGFTYIALSKKAEADLKAYIDKIEASDAPHRIPDSDNFDTITHSAFGGITNLEIPARITEIGGCAFAKTKDLVHVMIRGAAKLGQDCFNGSAINTIGGLGVTEIGAFCFWHCNNLERLELPRLQSAGNRAIGRCEKLRRVDFTLFKNFGKFIYDCPNLTYINLGEHTYGTTESKFDVTTVQMCPKLETLILPSDVVVEEGACAALRKDMAPNLEIVYSKHSGNTIQLAPKPKGDVVPAPIIEKPTVLVKKFYGFTDESGWSAVARSKLTAEEIYRMASRPPARMTNEYQFSRGGDPEKEMSHFPDLVSIVLPEWVTEIPDWCFSQCYELESVVGSGVKKIGDHAFYCTLNLRNADFPNAVFADRDAFNGAGADTETVFNLPNLQHARSRAFWLTGARELLLPRLQIIEQNAIDENQKLESLDVRRLRNVGFLSVCDNPRLVNIKRPIFAKTNPFGFYRNGGR